MLTHGNMTIYKYLVKQEKRYHDKAFLYYENEVISYSSMLKRVNQVAHWLEMHGIRKGDTVAVMLKNSPQFYEVWFACGALGAVLLPINTMSTATELSYFHSHSESKGFIYDESLITDSHKQMLLDMDLKLVQATDSVWLSETQEQKSNNHYRDVDGSDVCSIIYTSGTTAKPKGVLITHENYLYAGHSSVLFQQLTSDDRYLIFLPLFHVNSQYYSSMATLVVGGSIILLEKFSANSFWNTVQQYQPTVSSFVATVIKILLRLDPHPFEKKHSMKQVGYGLFVPKSDVDKFKERFGIRLYQWYGMTESITTNITTPLYEELQVDKDTGILSIGKPGLGQQVKIIDKNGNEQPIGKVGEIIIKSPSLMKGYFKNKAATEDTLKDGWLYTGDNGYMNEEGYIWFVDRNKDMIKRAGENISSLEIENVLSNHKNVVSCAVIGVPDELREEKVVAFVEANDENLTEDLLREHCTHQLASFKIPQEFHFIDEFPLTSIGKIQKNVLRDEYMEKVKSEIRLT